MSESNRNPKTYDMGLGGVALKWGNTNLPEVPKTLLEDQPAKGASPWLFDKRRKVLAFSKQNFLRVKSEIQDTVSGQKGAIFL